MIKYFLGLVIGCSLAWSVDIIYTPGLNNFLGLILLGFFIFVLLVCLYDSYMQDEPYYKVVLFHSEVFLGFIVTLLMFFIDKFSDIYNFIDYEYYALPLLAMIFCIPWTVKVIILMRRDAESH